MCSRTAKRGRGAKGSRSGSVLVLAALLMVFSFAMLAFAVDVGYIGMVKTELQRTADAAALAAAWELIDEDAPAGTGFLTDDIANARNVAGAYCTANQVAGAPLLVDPNQENLSNGDVLLGYLSNPFDRDQTMDLSDASRFNAVRVLTRRSKDRNGGAHLFFGSVLGFGEVELQASATAALLTSIRGFRTPDNGQNLEILPFALDEETWINRASVGTDGWSWNPDTEAWNSDGTITTQGDGVPEINLYPDPDKENLPPGNRGTVDIGGNDNSTADIARQILHGVSASDLEYFGGELKLNDCGILLLNGDTGISAGVKDELAAIKGKPRMIPIFRYVEAPGNNATYTIVAFVGVRIMDVKLTGASHKKYVMIQPANCATFGVIPGPSDQTSQYIYSPACLVR